MKNIESGVKHQYSDFTGHMYIVHLYVCHKLFRKFFKIFCTSVFHSRCCHFDDLIMDMIYVTSR